jgi:hypothetical protein
MKNTISILILLLFVLKLNAQFSEKNAIYLGTEFNGGNFWGGSLNLNYVYNEKYSFQAGISGLMRESKSTPDDFSSGMISLFTLGLSNLNHYDEMETYQILAGRVFKLNNSNTRFNIAGGIGYTVLTEPINWKPVTDYTLSENYTYDVNEHGMVSLIINPKFEFPFTRFFGLILSPMLQINGDRTYVGLGVGAIGGLLRKRN